MCIRDQPRPWCRWESGSEGASHRLCESVPPFHTTAVQSGCLRLCASVLFPGYCPPRKQQIRPLRGASPQRVSWRKYLPCLLYTSDAADDLTRVDLGGRRIINKIIITQN